MFTILKNHFFVVSNCVDPDAAFHLGLLCLPKFPLWVSRPPDKSAYQKIIFLISQPKHMLWEQFCEIILNLDQWFRRKCRLKVFLIWSSDSPFVQRSVTICASLVEGIMRNNSVKLF